MTLHILQMLIDIGQGLAIAWLALCVQRLNKIMILQAKYNNSVTELFNNMFGVTLPRTEEKPKAQA